MIYPRRKPAVPCHTWQRMQKHFQLPLGVSISNIPTDQQKKISYLGTHQNLDEMFLVHRSET